ncbi:hypothetical protein [Lentzea sp. NPDC004782]|uniref:hypothetical protein n=1 Tax=Lentzea sp. NPDC004782 TaxID=3154458 RepID=UPI0033ACDD2B
MGVRYDYFAAPSDEAAAAVIMDGPGRFPVVETKWLDAAVVMGQLEELLTGRPYDEVVEDSRWAEDLAVAHGGELLVLTVTDGLRDALASVAQPAAADWARIEELRGIDVSLLEDVLGQLKALAAAAVRTGERLYCWVCV